MKYMRVQFRNSKIYKVMFYLVLNMFLSIPFKVICLLKYLQTELLSEDSLLSAISATALIKKSVLFYDI